MRHFITPFLLALLTIASTALTSPFSAVPVYAITGPGVLDPSNTWEPYGPRSFKLQLTYFTEEFSELAAFERGEVDVYDWTVPVSKQLSYDNNPDFLLTPPQGSFSPNQIDFNHESSDWALWGCDFQNGNSPCGAEIRKALAHLIDRPRFVLDSVLGGAATAIADPTGPLKIPSGSSLETQQSWDPVHVTTDAFNIAPDVGGFAQPGSADFCAARDHMVAADLGTPGPTDNFVDANNDCVIDNPPATQIRYMIRSDSSPRRQLGLGHMAAINSLFGSDVVAEILGDIIQLGDIVFVSRPIDDWSIYTGAWSLGGPLTDHLQALYGGSFASKECGGKATFSALNYGFIRVPEFDLHVDAAMQASDLQTFISETLAALDEFGKRALNIPTHSSSARYLALRDVEGAVNAHAFGYSNFFTILNGRASSYTPVNPTYTFGGNSGPDTLRWGQSHGTNKLNIFHGTNLWDFNVLGMIYETLVRPSPIEPDKMLSWMANSYRETVDASGNTRILLDLRSSMTWHDGKPVTADDVRFSFLSYRDAPASNLQGSVFLVLDVVSHGPLRVEIILKGRSLSHLQNIGVPIIPKHVWDTNNDGMVDLEKLDPSYDPLAAGILIGSGPFVCRSMFPADLGRVGTGCARIADGSRGGQTVGPGGRIVLERFDNPDPSNPSYQYMRTYNPSWPAVGSAQFQEFSWADKNDNAKVDIADVASVAACFGKTAPDTDCPADSFTYWDRLGTSDDITIEAVRVAARLDETWVDPFSWDPTVLANLVPFAP